MGLWVHCFFHLSPAEKAQHAVNSSLGKRRWKWAKVVESMKHLSAAGDVVECDWSVTKCEEAKGRAQVE